MDIKRKRIRTAIIAAVVIIAAIAAIIGLKVDPADYRKDIGEDVKKAEKLIKDAKVGNDNGQYSTQNLYWLEAEIARANAMIDAGATEIDDFRQESKALKKEIKRFEDLANKNSISAKEIKSLKKEKGTLKKEIKLEDNGILTFEMDCTSIEKADAVNPDVTLDGFFAEDVTKVLKENKKAGIVLTFLHNDAFPGRADIRIDAQEGVKAYNLYSYSPESNSLSYVSGTEVKDGIVSFSVASGGVWVLCETDPKKDETEEIKGESSSEKQELIAENVGGKTDKPVEGAEGSASSGASSAAGNSTSNGGSASGSSQNSSNSDAVPPAASKSTCKVTIVCDTILNNMADLNPAKKPYVPSNGVILGTVTVEIHEGESAFEVLKRVTRSYGIQMEFRNDPTYSGAYIEGINHLYEFDCGSGSGWMYKVNGWFPNYGCSQYKMKDGDDMVWCYTCNIGKDVGDQYYD